MLTHAVLRGTGATPCRAQGGYFLVADVSGSGAKSDMEYCERLADSKGAEALFFFFVGSFLFFLWERSQEPRVTWSIASV